MARNTQLAGVAFLLLMTAPTQALPLQGLWDRSGILNLAERCGFGGKGGGGRGGGGGGGGGWKPPGGGGAGKPPGGGGYGHRPPPEKPPSPPPPPPPPPPPEVETPPASGGGGGDQVVTVTEGQGEGETRIETQYETQVKTEKKTEYQTEHHTEFVTQTELGGSGGQGGGTEEAWTSETAWTSEQPWTSETVWTSVSSWKSGTAWESTTGWTSSNAWQSGATGGAGEGSAWVSSTAWTSTLPVETGGSETEWVTTTGWTSVTGNVPPPVATPPPETPNDTPPDDDASSSYHSWASSSKWQSSSAWTSLSSWFSASSYSTESAWSSQTAWSSYTAWSSLTGWFDNNNAFETSWISGTSWQTQYASSQYSAWSSSTAWSSGSSYETYVTSTVAANPTITAPPDHYLTQTEGQTIILSPVYTPNDPASSDSEFHDTELVTYTIAPDETQTASAVGYSTSTDWPTIYLSPTYSGAAATSSMTEIINGDGTTSTIAAQPYVPPMFSTSASLPSGATVVTLGQGTAEGGGTTMTIYPSGYSPTSTAPPGEAGMSGILGGLFGGASATPSFTRPSGTADGAASTSTPTGGAIPFGSTFVYDIDNVPVQAPSIVTSSGIVVNASVYIVDMEGTSADQIKSYKDQSKKVICYISAGTLESSRSDVGSFDPTCACGPGGTLNSDGACQGGTGFKLDGIDEYWLDVHSASCITSVKNVMTARMKTAKEKACDGVYFDNVDSYKAGGPHGNTLDDQIGYLLWLGQTAQTQGLAVGLQNSAEIIQGSYGTQLVRTFDFCIVDSCYLSNDCDHYEPFILAHKPMLRLEYSKAVKTCPALKQGQSLIVYGETASDSQDITLTCSDKSTAASA